MLVRFRALADHRSTLASSVVASFDTDPMSGYGYGPTLTSSVVADGDCMSISSLIASLVRDQHLGVRQKSSDFPGIVCCEFCNEFHCDVSEERSNHLQCD
jgi:hypothetical protein